MKSLMTEPFAVAVDLKKRDLRNMKTKQKIATYNC